MTSRPLARCAVALALLAGPAWGQTPAPLPIPTPIPATPPAAVVPVATITAPPCVLPDSPLILFGDQSISTTPLQWIILTPKGAFEQFDRPEVRDAAGNITQARLGNALFVIRKPVAGATYKVALAAIGSGTAPAFTLDMVEIPVGYPFPPPSPSPSPTPTPSPTPSPAPAPPAPSPTPVTLARPAHVTIVYDSNSPDPALAAIVASTTLPGAVRALNAQLHTLDVNSPEYATRKLDPFVKQAGGAPALVIQGAPAKVGGPAAVVDQAKLPATESAVVAYLKTKIGGAQ